MVNEDPPSEIRDQAARQTAQVIFLRRLRRECQEKVPVVARVILLSGKELKGKLDSFDLHTLVVTTRKRRYLIYKHAVESICRSSRKPQQSHGVPAGVAPEASPATALPSLGQ